jgi:hypothetical protein
MTIRIFYSRNCTGWVAREIVEGAAVSHLEKWKGWKRT